MVSGRPGGVRVGLVASTWDAVHGEGGVWLHAGPALDEALASDDARRQHPEPLHHRA